MKRDGTKKSSKCYYTDQHQRNINRTNSKYHKELWRRISKSNENPLIVDNRKVYNEDEDKEERRLMSMIWKRGIKKDREYTNRYKRYENREERNPTYNRWFGRR